MGLTNQSCGKALLSQKFNIPLDKGDFIIALAGNPNVGKSTVFNGLTGLNQHTGNWPGKTVATARGSYTHKNKKFILVDLPGTYSLFANSAEEQIARDFICFGNPDATIIVADATCLERNLNLALQIMELTDKAVLCLNLMDEAEKKGIFIDVKQLEKELGIPVIPTAARKKLGLDALMDATYDVASQIKKTTPRKISYGDVIETEIQKIIPYLEKRLKDKLDPRWVALRILEGDATLFDSINAFLYEEDSSSSYKEVTYAHEC